MQPESKPVVVFENVQFSIGSVHILNDLTFRVNKGDILILLGESGCGKTTTLKLINRLIEPSAGSITIGGRSSLDWDPIELRRGTGYVMQDGGLFPHLTVADNVALVPRLSDRGVTPEPKIRDLLHLVGLDPVKYASRYPHELSGGQRQRVGVARALASDPELMLLDEPFGALDALTRSNLQKEFCRLVTDLGKTAVFVTHDLHEAMVLGTHIALMEHGRIAVLDEPAGFRRSSVPLVKRYLETIENNISA